MDRAWQPPRRLGDGRVRPAVGHGRRTGRGQGHGRPDEERLEAQAEHRLHQLGRRGADAAGLHRMGRDPRRGAEGQGHRLHQLRRQRPGLLPRRGQPCLPAFRQPDQRRREGPGDRRAGPRPRPRAAGGDRWPKPGGGGRGRHAAAAGRGGTTRPRTLPDWGPGLRLGLFRLPAAPGPAGDRFRLRRRGRERRGLPLALRRLSAPQPVRGPGLRLRRPAGQDGRPRGHAPGRRRPAGAALRRLRRHRRGLSRRGEEARRHQT